MGRGVDGSGKGLKRMLLTEAAPRAKSCLPVDRVFAVMMTIGLVVSVFLQIVICKCLFVVWRTVPSTVSQGEVVDYWKSFKAVQFMNQATHPSSFVPSFYFIFKKNN